MLLSMLLNLSLIFVPFMFYSCCFFVALNNFLILFPKVVFRNIVHWPEQSSTLTPHELWVQNLTGIEYCERGKLLDPATATVYLPAKENIMYYYDTDSTKYNSSFAEEISRTFQTVILDCSGLLSTQWTNASDQTSEDKFDQFRTIKYLKWISIYNSERRLEQPEIKVWLRVHSTNNVFQFDDFYCIALAMAGNKLHPGTVSGLLLYGETLSPKITLNSAANWTDYFKLWKTRAAKWNLKLGLTLGLTSCMDLQTRSSLVSVLDKFDAIYYYRETGGAYIRRDEGANAIIGKKFEVCRSLMAVKSPRAVTVKNALTQMHIMFRRFSDYGNYCVIYDWRAG